MSSEADKQKLLALVQRVYDAIVELTDTLSPAEKDEKGSLQLWSAKDTLANLAFWLRHFNTQLEKSAKGEKVPTIEYFNEVNDGVLLEHMDQPFEDAWQDFKSIHAELMKKYEAFSVEELFDPQKYAWLEGHPLADRILGNSVTHLASHLSDYYAKRQKLDKAIEVQEIVTRMIKEFPSQAATATYNLACFYALNGMQAKAIACLKEAFKGRPDLIDWSKKDSDLDSLREMPEFISLF